MMDLSVLKVVFELVPNKIDQFLKKEVEKTSSSSIKRNFAIASLFPALLAIIVGFHYLFDSSVVMSVILIAIAIYVQTFISLVALAMIFFFIAKQLGGKGKLNEHMYLSARTTVIFYMFPMISLISFGVLFLMASPFDLGIVNGALLALFSFTLIGIAMVPPTILGILISTFLGHILMAVAFPSLLYYLFINYKILRVTHGLSRLKALLIVLVIPAVLIGGTFYLIPDRFYMVGRMI